MAAKMTTGLGEISQTAKSKPSWWENLRHFCLLNKQEQVPKEPVMNFELKTSKKCCCFELHEIEEI